MKQKIDFPPQWQQLMATAAIYGTSQVPRINLAASLHCFLRAPSTPLQSILPVLPTVRLGWI